MLRPVSHINYLIRIIFTVVQLYSCGVVSRDVNLIFICRVEGRLPLTIVLLREARVFLVPNAGADIVLVLHDGGQVGVVAGRRLGAGAYRQLMTLVLRRVWK